RNVGIQNARGRYVAFLDDDDEWLPRKLERQVPFADKYSVVGCRTSSGETRKILGVEVSRKQTAKMCEGQANMSIISLNDVFYNTGRLSPTVALTRRDYLLKIGGFDKALVASQGRDLFVRLVMGFGPGLVVEEILTTHYQKHGRHRITDSSNHLKGGWQEFRKHSKYMPWHLRRWRRYELSLRETRRARGMSKAAWCARVVLNMNPWWPWRSLKSLVFAFLVD
ncbi:MAG: glycosyltransferase, partial [Planctomycetota bacterium]